ncbi:MAG: hypothetical protein R3F34_08300 [Planctomycetota bacterium]
MNEAQREHRAVRLRQFVDGAREQREELLVRGGVERVAPRTLVRVERFARDAERTAAPPAQSIDRAVSQDRREPRAHRLLAAPRLRVAHGVQERGLHEVLRFTRVAHDVRGDEQETRCRRVEDARECLRIAGVAEASEVLVDRGA